MNTNEHIMSEQRTPDIIERTLETLNTYIGVENYTLVGSFAAKMHGVSDIIVKDIDIYAPLNIFSKLWKDPAICKKIYVSRPEFEVSEDGVFSGLTMRIRPATLLPINVSRPCDLNNQVVPVMDTVIKMYGSQPMRLPTPEAFINLLRLKGRLKDLARADMLATIHSK